jgi:hypothetical protein
VCGVWVGEALWLCGCGLWGAAGCVAAQCAMRNDLKKREEAKCRRPPAAAAAAAPASQPNLTLNPRLYLSSELNSTGCMCTQAMSPKLYANS